MSDLVSPVPQFAQEEVKRVYATHFTEVAYDRIRDCVELPFNVSDQDLSDLHEAFPGMVFKPDTTKPQRLHPVAATGLLVTQDALESKVKDKSYIEIGAAFARTPPMHSCYRIDGRDEQRVTKAKVDTPVTGDGNVAKRAYLSKVLEGSTDARYCRNGFHKCDVKAEVAIANHVYDITPEEIAEGFQRHCLDAMYVGLILPTEALYGISRWNDTYKYGFQARDKSYNSFLQEHETEHKGYFKNLKQRVFGVKPKLVSTVQKQIGPVAYTEEEFANQYYTMYFKDPSLLYSHKRKTWNFWMTSNTFTARGMNFVVERYRVLGPITIVLITRTTMGTIAESPLVAPLTDEVPLLDISKCYKTLLNQFNSYRSSGRAKQIIAMMPHVLVPKDIHSKVMVYALAREDGNFTRHHIVSYVRAISQRVTIGGAHVQSGFAMDAEEYEAICIALYIEANIRRQETTKVIGELIKNITTPATFLEKCFNTFTSMFENVHNIKEFQFMPSVTARKIAKLFTAKVIAMQLVAEVTEDKQLSPTHYFENTSFVGAIPYGPDSLEQSIATLEFGEPDALVPQGLLPALQEKHQVSLVETDGHFQPMLHKNTHCRHGVAYSVKGQYEDDVVYEGARFAYDEFVADDYVIYELNIPKTAWKLSHFIEVFKPYTTHLIASEPGNDLSLFPLNGIEAIYHEGPPREGDRSADICRQFNIKKGMKVNVSCRHCLKHIPRKDAVYCDVGAEPNDEKIVALQINALIGLRATRVKFVLKLQRYFKHIAYPTAGSGTLANLLHDYLVFQVKSPNANEAYVTNMCTAGTDCVNICKYGINFNHQISKTNTATVVQLQPTAPFLDFISQDLVQDPPAPSAPVPQPNNPLYGHYKDQRPYTRRKRNRNKQEEEPEEAKEFHEAHSVSTAVTPEGSLCSSSDTASSAPSVVTVVEGSLTSSQHSDSITSLPDLPWQAKVQSWCEKIEPEPVDSSTPPPKPPRTPLLVPVRKAPPPPTRKQPKQRPILKRPTVPPPPPPMAKAISQEELQRPIPPPRCKRSLRKQKEAEAQQPPAKKVPPPRPPPPKISAVKKVPPPRPPPPIKRVPQQSKTPTPPSSEKSCARSKSPAPRTRQPSPIVISREPSPTGSKDSRRSRNSTSGGAASIPDQATAPSWSRRDLAADIPETCSREVFWTLPKWAKCSTPSTSGKQLRFKSRREEGVFLSNFQRVDIKGVLGKRPFHFRSTEGFYQYYKNQDAIGYHHARSPNPFEIKKKVTKPMCCHQHGLAVMARALEIKFAHPEMQSQLLATGHRPLYEDTRDKFWGSQPGALGHLARLLMLLRAHLRGEELKEEVVVEAPKQPTPPSNQKYINEATIDLADVVGKGKVVQLGIRSMDAPSNLRSDMPNAYHLAKSARTGYSVDGNLITIWGVLNGGKEDKRDTQAQRLRRTHKILESYLQSHRTVSFHVPATLGCGALGGDPDEWHEMLVAVSNKYKIYITKSIRPSATPPPKPTPPPQLSPVEPQALHVAGEMPFLQYPYNLFKGYRRVDVLGDGNCLPRAISHILYGTERRYKELLEGYEKTAEDIETSFFGEALISHIALNYGITIAVVRDGRLTFVYGNDGVVVPLHLHFAHYNALVPDEPDYDYDETTPILLSHEGVPKDIVDRTFGVKCDPAHYHKAMSWTSGPFPRKGGIFRTTDDAQDHALLARSAFERYDEILFPASAQRTHLNSQKMMIVTNIANVMRKKVRFYDDTVFCDKCAACNMMTTYPLMGVKVTGNVVDNSSYQPTLMKPSTAHVKMDDKQVRGLLTSLRRELATSKNSKPEFIELNRTAMANVDALLKNRKTLALDKKIEGFTGVPGSGKTYTIVQNYNNQGYEVVVPFRRLLDEYRQAGFRGKTHVAGVDGKQREKVILDEVFALSPGLFVYYLCTSTTIIVIGDPYQMYNVDELNIYKDKHVRDLFDYKPLTMLNHSFTVPHDVCAYLNSTVYKDRPFTTSSPVLNSVEYVTTGGVPTGKLIYSFTTNYALRQGAVTVASIQGMRQKETHLMVESNSISILRKIPEQVVVALSRHTQKIFIHLATENLRAFMDVKKLSPAAHTCLVGGFQFHREHYSSLYTAVEFGDIPEVEGDDFQIPFVTPSRETKRKLKAQEKLADRLGVDSVKVNVVNVTDAGDDIPKSRTAYVKVPEHTKASLEAAGLNLISDGGPMHDAHNLPESLWYEPVVTEDIDYCIVRNVSLPLVEDILTSISPSSAEPEPIHFGYDHTEFEQGTGRLTIYPSILDSTIELGAESEKLVRKLPIRLRGRPCDFRNKSQQLHCMLRRYANTKAPHKGETPAQAANQLFTGFKRMCQTEDFPQITDELVSLCFAEQMVKIKQKGDVLQAAEYDLILREYSSKITCFLKNQTKKDLSTDSWLKPHAGDIKAGQGISAQPKMVNIMVGALVRAVSKLVESVLKPQIILGTGVDPVNLSSRIKQMNLGYDPQGIEIDVSEFDSQRGEWTDLFMDKVYAAFGIEPERMAYMTSLNKFWTLDAGDLKQSVVGHFQSGRADTLLSNTLVSVAFFGTFFQETNLRLGLFQGDDVCLIADHVEQVVNKDFLKVELTSMPTFCGYMVRDGLTIDIPAMSAKLANRQFVDDASVESYRLGVSDWMRTVRSTPELHMAMHCAAYKYNCTFEEVAYLQGFLNDFAAGRLVESIKSKNLVLSRVYGVPVRR